MRKAVPGGEKSGVVVLVTVLVVVPSQMPGLVESFAVSDILRNE